MPFDYLEIVRTLRAVHHGVSSMPRPSGRGGNLKSFKPSWTFLRYYLKLISMKSSKEKKLCKTLRLPVTTQDLASLKNTMLEYKKGYAIATTLGWDEGKTHRAVVHNLSYARIRKETKLPSQLTCSSINKAAETLKALKTLKAKGKKVSKPDMRRASIRYDARSSTINLKTGKASLSTIDGRKKVEFQVPDFFKVEQDYKVCSADLVQNNKGRFFLHVVVEVPKPEATNTGHCIGVDLGVTRPMVTSDNKFYGKKHWKHVKQRYFNLQRSLSSKGTPSAKRHLKKLSGKVRRFTRDCDHVLSKKLVTGVLPGDKVILEHLTNIRERMKGNKALKRRLHTWSFAQLQSFIEYKASFKGVLVEYVNPAYTSQACSCCGHVSKSNRKTQSLFKCVSCSYMLNADLNASKNIKHIGEGILSPMGNSQFAYRIKHDECLDTSPSL